MNSKYKLIINGIALLGVVGLLSSCGGGGGGEGSEGSGGFEDINSNARAKFIVQDLADGVIERNLLAGIPRNTPISDLLVNGDSGTATVFGMYNFNSGISCGADCVKSVTNADLTISFSMYTVMSADNTVAVVNGLVFYENNRTSTQNGFNFSSTGGVTVGTFVDNSITYQVSASGAGGFAYRDTILEFVALGKFASSLSGYLIAGDGSTYNF